MIGLPPIIAWTAKQQALLDRYLLAGLRVGQIAAKMSTTRGAIKARLRRIGCRAPLIRVGEGMGAYRLARRHNFSTEEAIAIARKHATVVARRATAGHRDG